MSKGVLRQMSVFGKTFKYRVSVLELKEVDKKTGVPKTFPHTEFRLPGGSTLTFANWDIKGVRERFYREEYLNPEVHYNLPKETELSEFGVTAVDIRAFIEGKEELFDPLPPEPKPEPVEIKEPELSEAKGA